MKKFLWGFVMVTVGLGGAATVASAELKSLRGNNDIAAESDEPKVKNYNKDEEPFARDYLQQPPLIPHKIEGYLINTKHNKCLSCHSWKNYKEHNATKISQTHFESRDGAILANVSARRYFCTQCHVPQVDAPPLVENTFEPLDIMKVH